tara:strand:- start:99 stop:1244 length:1146 start_codon:yes stop_codon:yes gene_type:complete
MNSNNRLKGLSSIALSDIIGTSATAFFWFFLASLIAPEEYGEIFFYLGIVSIISSVVLLANQNTITVFIAKKIELQKTLYTITLISTFIASLILIFWFYRIDIIFVLVGYVINTLALGELLGKKSFNSYSKFVPLQKGLVVFLGLGFYYVFGVDGILYAIGLSYVGYTLLVYRGMKNEKLNFPLFKQHVGFISNNYSYGFTQIISGQIDKILIPIFISFSILGNYALGLQVIAVLNILPQIVYKFILPYDASGESNSKLKIITIFSSIGLSITGILLAPIIVPVIFPEFNESIMAIQIMSISVIPSSIALIFSSKFLGMEKSRHVLIGRIISLITITLGIILLGPNLGILGLAISFLLANSFGAIFLSTSNYYLKNKNFSN